MRILIAGASGAIGRALVRRLRANQHGVFALTNRAIPITLVDRREATAAAACQSCLRSRRWRRSSSRREGQCR